MRHPEGMTHMNNNILTHEGGALTPRKMSSMGRNNSDPVVDNDLPLWRNSVSDPERMPQVDFEETFHNYLAHSPIHEPDRQPYRPVKERSAFRPIVTEQEYPRSGFNLTPRVKHPTNRACDQYREESSNERMSFQPAMTGQDHPTDNFNQTVRMNHPTFRAREQLPREELPDRQSLMPHFQRTGPYRASDGCCSKAH